MKFLQEIVKDLPEGWDLNIRLRNKTMESPVEVFLQTSWLQNRYAIVEISQKDFQHPEAEARIRKLVQDTVKALQQ